MIPTEKLNRVVQRHEELARSMPGARVLAFPEGGHNLQKTRARELAQSIREALTSP